MLSAECVSGWKPVRYTDVKKTSLEDPKENRRGGETLDVVDLKTSSSGKDPHSVNHSVSIQSLVGMAGRSPHGTPDGALMRFARGG